MEHCDIEEHAVLFALISREVISRFPSCGTETVRKCVRRYGRERGRRMHDRCVNNHDPLTPENYQAYNERRSRNGQMNSVFFRKRPEFIIHVEKCAWLDAWKKHDLLEYGKYYCLDIDRSLTRGFSEDRYEVSVEANLSWGAPFCDMHWGFDMTPETEEYIRTKKEELSKSGSVCSYDYHTGHLFSSFASSLGGLLGGDGLEAITSALLAFAGIFGNEKVSAFACAYPLSREAGKVLEEAGIEVRPAPDLP